MLIGLTGSFGSGKSFVLGLFRKEGAVTVSADRIVHSLLRRKTVKETVKTVFGPTVLKEGKINRPALAKIIFRDKKNRRKLEKIIHPLVKEKILKDGGKFSRQNKLVVAEVPLLFESGFSEPFDYIVCVSARPEIIQNRMREKGVAPTEIRRRLSGQWKISEKEKRSDAMIDNSESRAETKRQVEALIKSLRRACSATRQSKTGVLRRCASAEGGRGNPGIASLRSQ
jgi:dephospho-CoA kinase